MATRPRRGYDDEFQTNAVELVRSSGKSIKEVAQQLGIPWKTLRNWWDRRSPAGSVSSNTVQDFDGLKRENIHLKRQLAHTELHREILKKALAICSQDQELKSGSR